MSISRLYAAIISTAAAVSALVAGASAPALAAEPDAPSVVSAELLSSAGDGCHQPAVRLVDGVLAVEAQTGSDSSFQLNAGDAAGQPSVAVDCVVAVRLQFDQLAQVRPAQYLMSGFVNTSAGTVAGHSFESSFDGTQWYGQRNTTPAGLVGPFYQGGGSHFDPWSPCGTELDLSFRVGLSLTAETGLSAGDSTSLDAPNGAVAELPVNACS